MCMHACMCACVCVCVCVCACACISVCVCVCVCVRERERERGYKFVNCSNPYTVFTTFLLQLSCMHFVTKCVLYLDCLLCCVCTRLIALHTFTDLYHSQTFILGTGFVTSTRDTSRDFARKNLFEWVDEDELFGRETYRSK